MANPNALKNAYLPMTRVHVNAGWKWAMEVGTDYWLNPSELLDQAAAASTSLEGILAAAGWIATSLVNTDGSGGDFRGGVFTPGSDKSQAGSYADVGTPNHFLTNADNDLLESPAMFGSAVGMQAARDIAGMRNLPNILGVSFWGAMTVNSADVKEASWGFWEDDGSALVPAEGMAAIYSDSANFALQAQDAVVGSVGPLVDTSWHYWNIELNFDGFISWSQDGVLIQRNAVSITTDEAPYSFGFAADGTNFPGLGLTHVYYDWGSGRSQ